MDSNLALLGVGVLMIGILCVVVSPFWSGKIGSVKELKIKAPFGFLFQARDVVAQRKQRRPKRKQRRPEKKADTE